MENDFLEFMEEKAEVPHQLRTETAELLVITLNPKSTIMKFYLLQSFGMFLTLFICPQYGFRTNGYSGLADWVMNLGPIYCAAFCSTVFFGGGLLFTNIFLKKSEIRWIFANRISLILPFNGAVWFLMMATKDMTLDSHSLFHGYKFDITWAFVSLIIAFLTTELMKVRFRLFR